MSGGSFDYLCAKDADDLLAGGSVDESIASMVQALAEHAPAACEEMRRYQRRLDVARQRYQEALVAAEPAPELRAVWHAMEWWQSGDWSKDRLDAAVVALVRA